MVFKKNIKSLRVASLAVALMFMLSITVFAVGVNTNQNACGFSEQVNGAPLGTPYLIGYENPASANVSYVGGVYAEGYIWLVPHQGYLLTRINPNDPSDIQTYNLSAGSANPTYEKPFYGAAYDKEQRCLWIYPWQSARICRFDLASQEVVGYSFNSAVLDYYITTAPLNYFAGGTFDGRYLWCAPYNTSKILKFDTVTHTYSHLSLANIPTSSGSVSFSNEFPFTGAIFDGTYVWMIPAVNNYILRVTPSTNDMYAYKLFSFDYNVGNGYFRDAVFDGTNIWLIPSQKASALYSFDTRSKVLNTYPFPNPGTVQNMGDSASGTIMAFSGGVYDGANIWLIPRQANRVVRFNIATSNFQGFSMTNAINTGYNLSTVDATTNKFFGAIFDGANIWLPPLNAPRLVKIVSTGSMSGTIRDSANDKLIPNALVTLTHSSGATFTVSTNASGVYLKTDIPTGTYTVSGSRADYDTKTTNAISVSSGVTADFSFKLDPHLPSLIGYSEQYTEGSWTHQNVIYQLSATPGAGATIKSNSYQFYMSTSGQWSTGSAADYAVLSAEGIYTIKGKVSDTMDHTAESTTFNIKIDKTPPVVNLTEGSANPISTTLDYSDALSGLKTALISVAGGAQNAAAPPSGTAIEDIGHYTLTLTDNAGNTLVRHFSITDGTVPIIDYMGCTEEDGTNFTVYCHIYKVSGGPIQWSTVNLYQGVPEEAGSKWIDQSWMVTSMSEEISFSGVPAGVYTVIAKDVNGQQSTLQIVVGMESLISLNVSIPVKMMFASFATDDGNVTSPIYEITNGSAVNVNVYLDTFDTINDDGVSLTASQEPDKLQLNLLGGNAFSGYALNGLQTGSQTNTLLGTLGNQNTDGSTGTLWFGGKYVGAFSATPKLPRYSTTLMFELVLPPKTQAP